MSKVNVNELTDEQKVRLRRMLKKRQRMRIEKNPKKKPEWIWDAICHMKNSNKSF